MKCEANTENSNISAYLVSGWRIWPHDRWIVLDRKSWSESVLWCSPHTLTYAITSDNYYDKQLSIPHHSHTFDSPIEFVLSFGMLTFQMLRYLPKCALGWTFCWRPLSLHIRISFCRNIVLYNTFTTIKPAMGDHLFSETTILSKRLAMRDHVFEKPHLADIWDIRSKEITIWPEKCPGGTDKDLEVAALWSFGVFLQNFGLEFGKKLIMFLSSTGIFSLIHVILRWCYPMLH